MLWQVVFNTPERPEWGDLMAMTPRTVHSIKMGVRPTSMKAESNLTACLNSVNLKV